jgi:hypothetical protein
MDTCEEDPEWMDEEYVEYREGAGSSGGTRIYICESEVSILHSNRST